MKQLLGNTDSLQLFPLSYPWAWDMYLENMDNHWTPREIPVANDVALWRSDRLSEAERHLFLSVMAQLTTFDVQRGDETAESLQGIIDPPELKHYLKRLADEEALHTWAYQFIIENMGLDPQGEELLRDAPDRVPHRRGAELGRLRGDGSGSVLRAEIPRAVKRQPSRGQTARDRLV